MRRRGEEGFALIAVMVVMLLLMAIGGAMHSGVIAETSLRGAHARATAGFYAAEAGINRGMGDYRNMFLSFDIPDSNDFNEQQLTLGQRTVKYQLQPACGAGGCPLAIRVPAGRPFANLNASLFKYVAQSTSEVHDGDVEVSLGTEFDVNWIPLFQFLAFYERDLEINPGPAMTLQGPIHTNGSLYMNSNATLAIQDAPPLINTVSVTAAGSIYRGRKDIQNTPKCGGTVQIDALADTNEDDSLDPRTMTCTGSGATSQTDANLAPWLGAIRARQPYVAVPSPDVLLRGSGTYWRDADLRIALDLTTPFGSSPNLLYKMVVLNDADGIDAARTLELQTFMTNRPGRIFYNDVPIVGGDQPAADCGSASPTTANAYCRRQNYAPQFGTQAAVYACAGSDLGLFGTAALCPVMSSTTLPSGGGAVTFRRGGFYNNREQRWMYMLNLNLRDLLAWNRARGGPFFDPDDTTEGGVVVFLTVKGPRSTGALDPRTRYGVRVFGSPNLDFPPAGNPTGVTVVSDQAIYVEGDYNVNVGQPNYNVNFPKQPAAFMGDTINVLSALWSGPPAAAAWTSLGGVSGCRNDCQSRKSLTGPNERPATNSYVNAAFLGGVDDTNPSSTTGYNGGFENYPRFHERWTGFVLQYRGSFVSLGRPTRANGAWCGTGGNLTTGCNIYDAPTRNWNYDTDFQNAANLPPITPSVVSVEQILFTENFR